MRPVVAIVGRPNVGKSTLFNRLIGERKSIVEDQPSITRDRVYGLGEWLGRKFVVIDTGGLAAGSEERLSNLVQEQAHLAIEEASVILFMVDAKSGLTTADREVAELLRRTEKPVILVVNKTESRQGRDNRYDFYELGFDEVVPISAEHGHNTGDLLDKTTSYFEDTELEVSYPEDSLRIAFVGRPNVGKSSLLNTLLGEERVIVSETPGTTREAVDTIFLLEDRQYILIDTAGLRRKSRIKDSVEHYSVVRALRAVQRADVVVLVLDCIRGLDRQDKRIAGIALDEGRGMAIAINKWDLAGELDLNQEDYGQFVRRELGFVDYAPLIFVSALTGQGVLDIVDTAEYIADQHARRVRTGELNRVIDDAVATSPPQSKKGKRLRIFYATQVSVHPPHFVLFTNDPDLLSDQYERYLKSAIREEFGFAGTPLRITARERGGSRD